MLSGEPLLIVEGQERPLRRWDFVHCPPGTRHMIVGAGDEPAWSWRSAPGGTSTRAATAGRTRSIRSPCVTAPGCRSETDDATVAYAHLPPPRPVRYRAGWLPEG